jgi:membrane-bound serine protease (ClpP class)
MRYLWISFLLLLGHSWALAQSGVLVLEIRNEIDPRMRHYVEKAIAQATEERVAAIIVDMDTYGGTLDDADFIRKTFLDCEIPIYCFINKNAASAGALIAIACDSIYMQSGSNIGAATVVGGDGNPVADKYQSYMRSMMRSTAETQKRNPDIAEGMVGKAMGQDSVTVGGVITLTTSEALSKGFCEAELANIEAVLQRIGMKDAKTIRHEPSTSDVLARTFLNPWLKSVLLILILAGIYYEFQQPGIGFALAVSVLAAILYFLPNYIYGLAANWEIILFVIGLILIGLEVFVFPGFGLSGALGFGLVISSLLLALVNNDFFDFTFVPYEAKVDVWIVALLGIVGGGGAIVFFSFRFMKSKTFERVALSTTAKSADGYSSNPSFTEYIGLSGICETDLRPAGKIKVGTKVLDASSRGEFIASGTPIEILYQQGPTLFVRHKTS